MHIQTIRVTPTGVELEGIADLSQIAAPTGSPDETRGETNLRDVYGGSALERLRSERETESGSGTVVLPASIDDL